MASLGWALVLLAGVSLSSAELGTVTSVEEYPSIVQVESRVGIVWLQQCAGSVLTSYHILSAASCFQTETSLRRIRAGSSYRGVDGEVAYIYVVYSHPSFGILGQDGDIAIARLEWALPMGDTIKQAAILGEGVQLPTGLPVTLVGWGTTAEGGDYGNNYLHSLQLRTMDYDNCINIYLGEEHHKIITENMICAALPNTNGRDLDSRDLGSPVYYSDTTIGVVSFGVARGEDSWPLGLTSIASYTNWIIETASYL